MRLHVEDWMIYLPFLYFSNVLLWEPALAILHVFFFVSLQCLSPTSCNRQNSLMSKPYLLPHFLLLLLFQIYPKQQQQTTAITATTIHFAIRNHFAIIIINHDFISRRLREPSQHILLRCQHVVPERRTTSVGAQEDAGRCRCCRCQDQGGGC